MMSLQAIQNRWKGMQTDDRRKDIQGEWEKTEYISIKVTQKYKKPQKGKMYH